MKSPSLGNRFIILVLPLLVVLTALSLHNVSVYATRLASPPVRLVESPGTAQTFPTLTGGHRPQLAASLQDSPRLRPSGQLDSHLAKGVIHIKHIFAGVLRELKIYTEQLLILRCLLLSSSNRVKIWDHCRPSINVTVRLLLSLRITWFQYVITSHRISWDEFIYFLVKWSNKNLFEKIDHRNVLIRTLLLPLNDRGVVRTFLLITDWPQHTPDLGDHGGVLADWWCLRCLTPRHHLGLGQLVRRGRHHTRQSFRLKYPGGILNQLLSLFKYLICEEIRKLCFYCWRINWWRLIFFLYSDILTGGRWGELLLFDLLLDGSCLLSLVFGDQVSVVIEQIACNVSTFYSTE